MFQVNFKPVRENFSFWGRENLLAVVKIVLTCVVLHTRDWPFCPLAG